MLAVISQPDRPAGRGKQLTATPVKQTASAFGLPVHTPTNLRGSFVDEIAALQPDALVVVSYGRLLPAALLSLAPYGAFNLHPSALPLYRGAMPLAGPLRDGRSTTDVCVMLMDEGLDTGDVVARRSFAIAPDETGTTLHDRLAQVGADVVLHALAEAAAGCQVRQSQAGLAPEAEILATFTRPLHASDLLLDWAWPAVRIINFVRAYAEQPSARADLFGQRMKVLRVTQLPSTWEGELSGSPGSLLGVHGRAAIIRCGDGAVALERLIPPNRNIQDGAVFARAQMMEHTA